MLFYKMKEGLIEVFSSFKLSIGVIASSLARMNTVLLTVNNIFNHSYFWFCGFKNLMEMMKKQVNT